MAMRRAVAVMAWAVVVGAMASGCYIDDEAYGCFDPEPLPAGECWVDTDCPRVECYEQPLCVAGWCRVLAQTKPTMCSFGVCTEDAVCVPCAADADCERVNQNECATLTCGDDGQCVPHPLEEQSPCLQSEGTCNHGACFPR